MDVQTPEDDAAEATADAASESAGSAGLTKAELRLVASLMDSTFDIMERYGPCAVCAMAQGRCPSLQCG